MIARKPYFPRVTEEIAELFRSEGLELLGIADAVADRAAEGAYRDWLERGFAGTMGYLRRHLPLKFHPELILPEARSVIVAGINYFQQAPNQTAHPSRSVPAAPPSRAGRPQAAGRVARYAWGRDYHLLLGGKLRRIAAALAARYPGEAFRPFTDATPLAERHFAEAAGIGFTGRNTLLISSQYGSWFLIGEILSTAHFPPSGPTPARHGACPSGCSRCMDVCPTGALIGPGRIDGSRCISYLTIEHRGSIPEPLRPLLGDWLFGCDLCQEVCPLNLQAHATSEPDFLAWRAGSEQELATLLAIKDDAEYSRRFVGSPLMRARRSGLLRNACIVAANLGARELLPLLRERTLDADPIIAEHSRWAVARLTA